MKGNYTRSTIFLATAMLLSLPLGALAQTPAPQQPPAQSPMMQQPPATQPPAPQPPALVPPMPQTPLTTTPPTTSEAAQTPATPEANGAAVLLDRISEIVDQSLGHESTAKKSDKGTPGAKGTSGVVKMGKTSAGQVSIDRASLDEIKAEVEQLKIMLKDRKP